MKIKTAEAIGPTLDWLVAKCEGYTLTTDGISMLLTRGSELRILGENSSALAYNPSTNWEQGGPIIERERIILLPWATDAYYNDLVEYWKAGINYTYDWELYDEQVGPTPLIAAMRWYVASKLGDEVEIPEELL